MKIRQTCFLAALIVSVASSGAFAADKKFDRDDALAHGKQLFAAEKKNEAEYKVKVSHLHRENRMKAWGGFCKQYVVKNLMTEDKIKPCMEKIRNLPDFWVVEFNKVDIKNSTFEHCGYSFESDKTPVNYFPSGCATTPKKPIAFY